MAKKKDKPQVINNIQELNLELDYDKLAEAIVKAQNAPTIQENDCEDEELFVEKVVSGKIPKGKMFSSTLSKLMQTFFYLLAIASVFLCGFLGIAIIIYVFDDGWGSGWNIFWNIYYLCGVAALILFEIFFVKIVWKIANEIGKEQDKNYIISAFSSVVSLVALIVALVALFKGVG